MKKIFSLLVILLTISCSNVDDVVNTTTQNPVDVYVAGQKNNNAAYWKNNNSVFLNGGEGATADTICVSNNNIHILGKKYYDNWTQEYLYWKNGVLTNLNEAYSTPDQSLRSITGMDVDGDDVYFVGYTKNPLITAEAYELAYWKNGVKTVLAYGINNFTYKAKIKVINYSVYVIGGTINCLESCYGVYVNGVFQSVSMEVVLKDITQNNNEVYVYGTNFSASTSFAYFKNLSTNIESTISNIASINKMKFDNNNTYISDGSNVFKNNSQINSSSFFSHYIDFSVLNDTVFILKREGDFGTNDVLYINNEIAMTSANDEKYNSLFIYQN